MESELAKTAVESHGAGLGIPNSLFGRNNSLFREQQGTACKPLKLLDELTPASAELTGNFADSLLFSLLSGN